HARGLVKPVYTDLLSAPTPVGCPVVAVGIRQVDELIVVIDEAVVDRPTVDPDRGHRSCVDAELQPVLDFRHDAAPVPTQMTFLVGEWRVAPTMQNLHFGARRA